MKAKKPLLLAVLVLTLLAVALIVPAVASGKPEVLPNQPVNWVSNGENSNNFFRDLDWQGGHSVLVREMPDGSLEGHGFLVGIKPPVNRGVMRAINLLNYDPFTTLPIDVFYEDDFDFDGDGVYEHYRVAEVVMDFGPVPPGAPEGAFQYFKIVLMDGGEPKTADMAENFIGGPGFWIPFGGPYAPFSNVQIHLGE